MKLSNQPSSDGGVNWNNVRAPAFRAYAPLTRGSLCAIDKTGQQEKQPKKNFGDYIALDFGFCVCDMPAGFTDYSSHGFPRLSSIP